MKTKQTKMLKLNSIQEDLRVFTQRLTQKVQKAMHLVGDLEEFFMVNITKAILQNSFDDESETEDDYSDNAYNVKDFKQESTSLNSIIASFHKTENENYNKHQIEILNYIKSDKNIKYLDTKSLTLNRLIEEQFQKLQLSESISRANNLYPKNQISSKNKLVGNHYKHIYFLSSSDSFKDEKRSFYYNSHFRYLYVSSIKKKFVFILIDIGSAMSNELMDITRQYGNN